MKWEQIDEGNLLMITDSCLLLKKLKSHNNVIYYSFIVIQQKMFSFVHCLGVLR